MTGVADRRVAVLAEVTRAFAEASFDANRLFDTIASRVADLIGDSCGVLVLDAARTRLDVVSTAERDPDRHRRGAKLLGEPLLLERHVTLRNVIASGAPLVTGVTPEMLRRATSPAYVEFAQEAGLHSSIVVPLRGHSAVTGLLSLNRYRGSAPYDDTDVDLAVILADHAALALDNARMHAALAETQEAHEHFFRTSPIAMYAFDVDTLEILAANDAALRLYGYSLAELLTLKVDDLRGPSNVPLPALLAATGDGVLRTVGVHRRKDGTLFEVEGTSHLASWRGKPARFAVVMDISELVTARRDRRRAESRFDRLASSGVIGILVTDFDGHVREANDAIVEMFGYTRAELLDGEFRWAKLVSPQWQAEHEAKLERLRTSGIEHPREREYVHKDGRRLPVLTGAAAVEGASEVITFILDLSGQKWAQGAVEHLREARISEAKYQVANRELEAFSYSVAHDLRAPLRAMSGFSRLLVETHAGSLDAEARDWLEEIRRNTERMGELIDALLALSRISRGELVMGRVDLVALARETLATLAREEPGRSVVLDAPSELVVTMDAKLARTVIDNLVANAWKFTRPTPEPRISIGTAARPNGDAYFVADNGVGFDMAYAQKLFAPLQRLHSTKEFPGTGIGLATVQRVIHRHGGRIWADGEPGRGATFYFTLPMHDRSE